MLPLIVTIACIVVMLSFANFLRLSLRICNTESGRVAPRERRELNSPSVTSPSDICSYEYNVKVYVLRYACALSKPITYCVQLCGVIQ